MTKSEEATPTHGESALVQPRIVRPDRIRMLRDWKFVGKTRGRSFKCTIRAGEIGGYFSHSYCFTFPARRGWVPYISADWIMRNPDAWESLPNTKPMEGCKPFHAAICSLPNVPKPTE